MLEADDDWTPGASIVVTIPAKPEFITLGRLALTGIARLRAEPLCQEVLGDLKLALTEACTNSVRHAYGDGEGTVEIVYELHADKLVVEVADDGEGFEPPPDRAALLDEDELSEGGLGIASGIVMNFWGTDGMPWGTVGGVSPGIGGANISGTLQLVWSGG